MIAIDTNILLYSIDLNFPQKLNIACNLIDKKPSICAQNLSEFINVILNRWKYPKAQTTALLNEILNSCKINATNTETYRNAILLIQNYNFQLFDVIIVASALENNCEFLYTEDMQHGLVVENNLKIINPFL